jgi:Asp-tRNA(Asn)/Glu-tRNA(Gln) amidotransferase A subunit family amidase
LSFTNDQLGLHARSFDDIIAMDVALCGKVAEHEAARCRVAAQSKIVVAFPRDFFVNFTLPEKIASLSLAERSGLRSCRAAASIRRKLEEAKALLNECRDFCVSAAEWRTLDNPKFGGIGILYHMLFGFEYAQGRPLNMLACVAPWEMLTQDVLYRFGPQPEGTDIQKILEDMRPIGAQHDPAGRINECEAALRFFIGPYTDQCTALWNSYFDANGVDVICVPNQFCATWSWSEFAGHRIPMEVKGHDGEYTEELGPFTWESNWILFSNKGLAIPKVAVPLGLDEAGRPVGCCLYGRAVPSAKRFDAEFVRTFDLDFLHQVRRIVSTLHADGSLLRRVEPAATPL